MEKYRQLPLDAHETSPQPLQRVETPQSTDSLSIAQDPVRMPHSRLKGDFWHEFYNEWNFREQHDLEPVDPQEFRRMRDFSDRLTDQPAGRFKPTETILYDEHTVAAVDKTSPIIERLQEGIERAMTEQGFKEYLDVQSRFHQYSPNNVMLINIQRPDARMVAGYNAWKGMGRQVKKGEQAIRIFAPITKVLDDEEQGIKVKTVTGFKAVPVFDVQQTEGEPLPEPPRVKTLEGNDPIGDEAYNRLADFATANGVDVVKGPLYRDGQKLNGAWSPSHKAIVINHDLRGDQEVKTLAHEVAHFVADHRDRVGVEDKETIAESAAYVALSHFGIDTADYSFNYVVGWSQKPEVFKRNIEEIQKVSSVLINAIRCGCPPAEE